MPSLSLCAIVRNEAANLPRMLGSVTGLVDAVVLLDTGSTDGTVGLARSLGATVYEQAWPDSFAAARNQAINHCRTDWILSLDADEALEVLDHDEVRRQIAVPARHVVAVELTNYMPGGITNRFFYPRLYRNDPAIRYAGRVHNQLIHPYQPVMAPIRVYHWGYLRTGDRRAGRLAQTLALCETMVAEDPHNPSPHFYLAQTHFQAGNFQQGLAAVQGMLACLPGGRLPPGSFLGDIFAKLATHYYNSQQLTEALQWIHQGLTKGGNRLDLHFLAARVYTMLGQPAIAIRHWQEHLAARAHGTRERGWQSTYFDTPGHLGEVWESLASAYTQLNRPIESRAILDEWTQRDPANPDALAQALAADLAAGDSATALGRLGARPPAMVPTPALLMAETSAYLHAGGADAEAAASRLVETPPKTWPPRAAYARWLAAQGRLPEARALVETWLTWLPADPDARELLADLADPAPDPEAERQRLDSLCDRWRHRQAAPADLSELSELAARLHDSPLALMAATEAWAAAPWHTGRRQAYGDSLRSAPGKPGRILLLPDRPDAEALTRACASPGQPTPWDRHLQPDDRVLLIAPTSLESAEGWLDMAARHGIPLTVALHPTQPGHWAIGQRVRQAGHALIGLLLTPLVPNLMEPWINAVRRWQRQASSALVPWQAEGWLSHLALFQPMSSGSCDLAAVALAQLGLTAVAGIPDRHPAIGLWLPVITPGDSPAEVPASPWAWTFPSPGLWLQRPPAQALGPLPAPETLTYDGAPCPVHLTPGGWQADLPSLGAGSHHLQAKLGEHTGTWSFGIADSG